MEYFKYQVPWEKFLYDFFFAFFLLSVTVFFCLAHVIDTLLADCSLFLLHISTIKKSDRKWLSERCHIDKNHHHYLKVENWASQYWIYLKFHWKQEKGFLAKKICRTNLTLFLPCCVSPNKTHRHISFLFFCLNMWLWCSFSCRFSFWKSFGRFSRHYKMRKILSAFFNVFSLHLFRFCSFFSLYFPVLVILFVLF